MWVQNRGWSTCPVWSLHQNAGQWKPFCQSLGNEGLWSTHRQAALYRGPNPAPHLASSFLQHLFLVGVTDSAAAGEKKGHPWICGWQYNYLLSWTQVAPSIKAWFTSPPSNLSGFLGIKLASSGILGEGQCGLQCSSRPMLHLSGVQDEVQKHVFCTCLRLSQNGMGQVSPSTCVCCLGFIQDNLQKPGLDSGVGGTWKVGS